MVLEQRISMVSALFLESTMVDQDKAATDLDRSELNLQHCLYQKVKNN